MSDIEKNTPDTDAKDVKVEKKSEKNVKEKKDKPSLGSRISSWFRAFRAEFRKIVWVTPRNVAVNTAIVLVVVVAVAAVIGLLDYVFSTSIVGLSRLV